MKKSKPVDHQDDINTDSDARLAEELKRRDAEIEAAIDKEFGKSPLTPNVVISKTPQPAKLEVLAAEIDFFFPRDLSATQAINDARAAFKKLVDLFGVREAGEKWAAIPTWRPKNTHPTWADDLSVPDPPRGAKSGPRNPEIDRQLLMFYRHWLVQFPDHDPGSLKRACAKMLNLERPLEFGNSEDAIMRKLQRLTQRDLVRPT